MPSTNRRPINFGRLARAASISTAWATLIAVSGYVAWMGWDATGRAEIILPMVAAHISAGVILAFVLPTVGEGPGVFRLLALIVVGGGLLMVDFFGLEQGAKALRAHVYADAFAARNASLVAYDSARAMAEAYDEQLSARRMNFMAGDENVAAQERISMLLAEQKIVMAKHKSSAHGTIGWPDVYNTAGAAGVSVVLLLILFAMFKPRDQDEAEMVHNPVRRRPSSAGKVTSIRAAAIAAAENENGGRKLLNREFGREAERSRFERSAAARRATT